MGNQTCGGDCGVLLDQQFKIPLNAVNRQYNNFQFIEFNEFFQYPSRFPYILSYLRKYNLHFEDIYFPTGETKRIVGVNLIKNYGSDIVWKSINEILNQNNIKFLQPLFTQSPQKYRQSPQIYRLLHWITTVPKLMSNIFKFQTLTKQGLVLLYFPLWGSHDQPTEIVIDDKIPINAQKDYYFYMPQINNVAMVLLQKALAKFLGSYQKLRQQGIKDLFQIIVGIPIMVENFGTRDQIEILSRYYRPHYQIKSYNKKLQNHHPEYFRFNLQYDSNVAISVWQQLQDQQNREKAAPAQIAVELMRVENQERVIRVAYSSKLIKDKIRKLLRHSSPEQEKGLFCGNEFLLLAKGDYLLHIYTKTDNVTANCNLITYSENALTLTYRKESAELCLLKKKMIENIFLKYNRDLEKCLFTDRVYSKFVWDGFRGILAFKNQEQNKVKVIILIKQEYRKKVKFEDSQLFQQQFFIKPYSKKIISFVKFIDSDVGNFYSQNISCLKNLDTISQGSFTPTSVPFQSQLRSPQNQYKSNFRSWDDGSEGNIYTPSTNNPYIEQ